MTTEGGRTKGELVSSGRFVLVKRDGGNRAIAQCLSRGMDPLCEIDTFNEVEANAAYIVQAVNAHDGLVAALELILYRVDNNDFIPSEYVDMARTALSKARQP